VKNVDKASADSMSFIADVNTQPFVDATKAFAGRECPASGDLPTPTLSKHVPPTSPLVPHVGEGTNCLATLEIEA
jgi:hypothetical protein